MPDVIITDQGPEFVGKEFTSYVANHACLHHVIDSQSLWQQGRTERAGGSIKEDLRSICQECSIVTVEDFDIAIVEAVSVRNSHTNRLGFFLHSSEFSVRHFDCQAHCFQTIRSTGISLRPTRQPNSFAQPQSETLPLRGTYGIPILRRCRGLL